jgi:hypothetical protein
MELPPNNLITGQGLVARIGLGLRSRQAPGARPGRQSRPVAHRRLSALAAVSVIRHIGMNTAEYHHRIARGVAVGAGVQPPPHAERIDNRRPEAAVEEPLDEPPSWHRSCRWRCRRSRSDRRGAGRASPACAVVTSSSRPSLSSRSAPCGRARSVGGCDSDLRSPPD